MIMIGIICHKKFAMLLIVALMSMNVYSQNQTNKKKMFVRVYDFNGKKMTKGHFNYATDSILELRKSNRLIAISIRDISCIKTKRSEGHTMLVPTLIGATIGAVLVASSADPDPCLMYCYNAGEGALIGGLGGAIIGSAVGGISVALKKPKKYIIDGDIEKWKIFKENFK